MDFNQIIQDFQAAMIVSGITPPQQIVADGQLHRFHLPGDRHSSKDGWYILFINTISYGVFGDWKEDKPRKWCSKKCEYMSFQERKVFNQQIAAAKLQRTIMREKEQEEAARQAQYKYSNAHNADPYSPYLVRKMIKPFHARQCGRYLILPVIDFSGKIWGLQYIAPNGSKWFLPHSAKTGHFIPIQNSPIECIKILICEGFATGATLAEAYPDACVIAACDAGNLKAVAVDIRLHLPKAEIVLCCDDDRLKPSNPGIKYGKEAAFAAEAFFTSPNWPEDAPANLTDFNDLQIWLSRTGSAK